jgi:mRNA interferase HigB
MPKTKPPYAQGFRDQMVELVRSGHKPSDLSKEFGCHVTSILRLRNLESYWKQPNRSDAAGALKAWFAEVRLAQWTSPQDVKNRYANASIIANNRVVFNIKGNDYRLVVAIAYKMQYVYVKFIGTHAEYDKVDATTVDQFKGA